MKFQTQYDPKYKPYKGEENNEDSLTLPNDNLTVRQLMVNNRRGIGIDAKVYNGIYTEDTEVPVFHDITDRIEYQKALKRQKQELYDELKKQKDEKEAEEAEKLARKAADDAKKEKGTQPPGDQESGK